MPHSYPIIEVKQIMNASEDELQNLLNKTPHALKSNGLIQVFGQSQHIPHIRLQIFLALMRLGKLSKVSKLQMQPYLFALLLLHKKWIQPLRQQFFKEPLRISDFTSQYELSLYLKMGGGGHWTELNTADFSLLPNDLFGLTGVTSCTVTKSWSRIKDKLQTLPTSFSLLYSHKSKGRRKRKVVKESIDLSNLSCHKATLIDASIQSTLPTSISELSMYFSDISLPQEDCMKLSNLQVLDLSFSSIDYKTLTNILQIAPNIHTLFVCGTPKLQKLPNIVQERNIKVFAFASACCTPDTNFDQKVRQLIFDTDIEMQNQGKELLHGLRRTTSTIQTDKGIVQSQSLYESFEHLRSIVIPITSRQYRLWDNVYKFLSFDSRSSDWRWQNSVRKVLTEK